MKTYIIEHLEIVTAEFRSFFNDDALHTYGTKTRLSLQLTLMRIGRAQSFDRDKAGI